MSSAKVLYHPHSLDHKIGKLTNIHYQTNHLPSLFHPLAGNTGRRGEKGDAKSSPQKKRGPPHLPQFEGLLGPFRYWRTNGP